MKPVISTLLLLFGLTQLVAQQPYPHLTTMKIKNECGDEPSILIHYDKSLGKEINIQRGELPETHQLYISEDNPSKWSIVALELKFNSTELPNSYFLIFSFGPSCDPGFYLVDAKTNESVGSTSGLEIYIPGGTSIYTTGHINSTFNKRRKYSIKDGKFQEIKPEFYYVGLKTKTLKPITLFADEELTTKLAYLPADYNVEVLAARRTTEFVGKMKYLIKTEVGLLGWSTIEIGAFKSLQIDGIMFLGD